MSVALVEHLQQQVVDLGVGLLDLVEQHHAVLLLLDGLGQEAAVAVADVAGRRADQLGVLVWQGVLGAVDPDQPTRIVVHRPRECLGELGLAGAGAADQEEGADRHVRVA